MCFSVTKYRVMKANSLYWLLGILVCASSFAAAAERVLYNFSGDDGYVPGFGALLHRSGKLYGVTISGGIYGEGVVYQLTPSQAGWTETVLYAFQGGADGGFPVGTLVADRDGSLYGVAGGGAFGFGIVYKLSPSESGWTKSVIYNFHGGQDGGLPSGGVIFDRTGNLYGVAGYGGVPDCPPTADSCGVVYKLTPSGSGWKQEVIYSFTGRKGDGAAPFGRLIFDSAGNLYGVTDEGGPAPFTGVVFQLKPAGSGWTERVIYDFHGDGDGYFPADPLALDQAGNLYGTTGKGGSGASGTVFRLTPASDMWDETILYNFQGGGDGLFPLAGVTLARDGNIYGTTREGGVEGCAQSTNTCGVVFMLAPNGVGGWTESVVYAFDGVHGAGPESTLIVDPRGNLYGTASGGANGFAGVVFEIKP
jgi:uncharacterized repeat protein (TIGR03803 family)